MSLVNTAVFFGYLSKLVGIFSGCGRLCQYSYRSNFFELFPKTALDQILTTLWFLKLEQEVGLGYFRFTDYELFLLFLFSNNFINCINPKLLNLWQYHVEKSTKHFEHHMITFMQVMARQFTRCKSKMKRVNC